MTPKAAPAASRPAAFRPAAARSGTATDVLSIRFTDAAVTASREAAAGRPVAHQDLRRLAEAA